MTILVGALEPSSGNARHGRSGHGAEAGAFYDDEEGAKGYVCRLPGACRVCRGGGAGEVRHLGRHDAARVMEDAEGALVRQRSRMRRLRALLPQVGHA